MEKLKGSIYLIGGFSLAGTSVIAARMVSNNLGPFTITAASLLFAILGLAPLCWSRFWKSVMQIKWQEGLALILQATCGIFLFRMFLIRGLVQTSASEAGILTGATPAITAFLAVILIRETFSLGSFLGIASTIAGIGLIQGLFLPGNEFSPAHFNGNLLVLCAALCESLFNVLSRISSLRARGDTSTGLDPAVQTMFVSSIAFFLCLVPVLGEQPVPALSGLGIKEWLALLWYGLFVTVLAFILFYAGIKRCNASTAGVFSGMMPLTSLILSVLILKEAAGWQQWLGGTLVVLGMVLIGSRRDENRRYARD